MGALQLPHTLDLYAPGVGGGDPTLAQANVAGYFGLLTAGARVRLQDVSRSQLALLWLDLTLQGAIADGMLVYWRQRATWWTVRGTPQVFDAAGGEHIEATVAANVTDGFFESSRT